jgi:dCMP deaminase
VARAVSALSTCPGGAVGAVVVMPDGTVASTGSNGAPRGAPHCTEAGCLSGPDGRCRRAAHAERNAILWARRDITGSTLFTTRRPCMECAVMIVQAGVSAVLWPRYPTQELEPEVAQLFRVTKVAHRTVLVLEP